MSTALVKYTPIMDDIFCYDILAHECEVVDSLTTSKLADSNRHLVNRSTVHTNGPTDHSSVAREESMAHNWTFCCFFSVSATLSRSFIYADVTHELSTFPLRFRDLRLSPITPSTFLQAFVLVVIIIVTKATDIFFIDKLLYA